MNKRPGSTVSEQKFTESAEGNWQSWNQSSPEKRFCEFCAMTVSMVRPKSIIETGVGQGYISYYVGKALSMYTGWKYSLVESDCSFREKIHTDSHVPELLLNDENLISNVSQSVGYREFSAADLVILDSSIEEREREIRFFFDFSAPGSIAIIHDYSSVREPHATIARLVDEYTLHHSQHCYYSRLSLNNPRGGILIKKAEIDEINQIDSNKKDVPDKQGRPD